MACMWGALLFCIDVIIASSNASAGVYMEASNTPKTEAIMGNIINNTGIVTQNQVGNNTIINQAPPPELVMEGSTDYPGPDGTIIRVVRVRIKSPYPANILQFLVIADGVTDVDINPLDAGMVNFGHQQRATGYFISITSPIGRYDVSVHLKKPTRVLLDYAFL